MRIRKTLAKALGQANHESAPSPPPSENWIPPFCFNTMVSGCSSSYCQLNQSPWDIYPNHHFFRTTFKCFEGVTPPHQQEEEHQDKSIEISENEKDILEIVPIMEITEEKPLLCERVNAQSLSKKKKRATEMKDNDGTILCKKHDGKNWYCKNKAKVPHNFCEYHLAQSQSYYRNSSSGSKASGTKKQKNKAIENINSDYYYYGTVAPSREKRRARNVVCASNVIHIDEEKMDENDAVSEEKEDSVEVLDCEVVYTSNGEEKDTIGTKRARKLTKFRSLDSFPEACDRSARNLS